MKAVEAYLLILMLYAPADPGPVTVVSIEKIAVYQNKDNCNSAARDVSGFSPLSAKFICIKVENANAIVSK